MKFTRWLKVTLTGKGFKDVQDRLEFHISISEKIIAIGLFSILAGIKLEFAKYFGSIDLFSPSSLFSISTLDSLQSFIVEKGLVAILALSTTIWYFLYARAVKKEMEIIVRTFSRFNPPHDWEQLVGRGFVPILSVGITVTFLALAWFIDNIRIYCLIVLVLNVLDIRANNILRQNLVKHFSDERYIPEDSDLHKEFIMRRRSVAEDYWVNKPQLERIGVFMIATVIAFFISVSDAAFGFTIWAGLAYLLLVAAVAVNEVTMRRWRSERNSVLDQIEEDEAHANRRRVEVSQLQEGLPRKKRP